MPTMKQKITPNLWFDHQAEEAVEFYTSIFRNYRIGRITRVSRQVTNAFLKMKKFDIGELEKAYEGQ